MPLDTKHIPPQIPVLNLTEDREILAEFTSEVLNHLISAENSILTLEAVPEDKPAIDNVFKIFYTIAGLSNFLNLRDIQLLSLESQVLLDMVRKKKLRFEGEVSFAISQALGGLGQLIILLNEQIENHGQLKSPYFDIKEILQSIENAVVEQKAEMGQKASGIHVSPKASAAAIKKYQPIEDLLKSPSKEISIDKETVSSLLSDLKAAQKNLTDVQNKLLSRQRELIREREFALKLSRQSQETAKIKSDFLADMSHEIRTLINTILGFSDLLVKSQLTDRQKEHLNAIVSGGRLLSEIVNDILDFSKIERGKLVLESISFNLNQLVDDIFRILQAKVQGKDVRLLYEIGKDVRTNVIGDPTRLKQILINLVDNAIKFTDKGEVKLIIANETAGGSQANAAGTLIRFTVKDTGVGIPEAKKGRIFESFSQADSSIVRKYGGSGLGLTICKGYVEAMGGKIWVESSVGQGSSFIFTVPFAESKSPGISSPSKEAESAGGIETALEGSCKGIRVLVVDDSAPNQELMSAYFECIGCSGEFANNGQEAIDKIKSGKYDLCFMDLQMPVMGGMEASEIIRQNITKELPIVALTATAMEEKKNEYLKSGINGYLEKPFDIMQLQQKILQFAGKKR